MTKTLRLILGDQLHSQHSWFQKADDSVTYLMMEMRQETDYVTHHIQKVVGFFLAMRTFSEELKKSGHQVLYFSLDHPDNLQNLKDQLESLISKAGFDRFEYLLPDEYRLDRILKDICEKLPIPTQAFDTEHFLTTREFLRDFFSQKKTYLMETFYREMRRKYDILMDGKDPLTGQWNYDQENRQALKDKKLLKKARIQPKKVHHLVQLLEKCGVQTIGAVDPDHFTWPTSRAESLDILNYFCENLLVHFGAYQDALTTWDPFLFHSRLSFSMNVKMLSPLEVVQTVEKYWFQHQDRIHIAQVEGFIRQIIGWREYMRGIYWARMPEFANLNFFGHDRRLPAWYWSGKTKMNCLSQAIGQSLDLAYAHHIQRLMVTGNFALLAGIHPDEVDRWYLGIYIDAIEWVEITNTRGMSQFADGGIVGTKPYVSSANYIKKQGNYCDSCAYDSTKKTGYGSCPFNSLYWHFYARNQDKLEKNPRIGMMYRTWDKMTNQQEVLEQAESYLNSLENL
jgi:deoxyribodipyrimidine photolyase-related protein